MGLFGKKTPATPPPLVEIACPACGHSFIPPRVVMVTQAVVARYGPNPVQCPECKHIWSRT